MVSRPSCARSSTHQWSPWQSQPNGWAEVHPWLLSGTPRLCRDTRESSSLPRLRLVQNGERASPRRLPITPPHLRRLRPPAGSAPSYEERLLWAAAAVCFFGFFSTGEITASSASAFDPSLHLAWGDVSISGDNQALRVFLKRSKTDQYGRGTEVE